MNQVSAQPTHSQLEVVERVLVDGVQFGHQGKCELHHGAYVHVLPLGLLNKGKHTQVGSVLCKPETVPQTQTWAAIRKEHLNIVTLQLQMSGETASTDQGEKLHKEPTLLSR